jgi:cell division protein FtsB
MAIIKQHDKRSGITYAYESISYWDKEKKQSRSKRKLIGRIDPETGEIIPTDGRGRKGKKDKVTKEAEEKPDYKALYEKLQKKCMALETLIEALKKEIDKLQGEE